MSLSRRGLLGAGLLLGAGCAAAPRAHRGRSAPERTATPSSTPVARAADRPPAEITHGPRTVPAVALTFHGAGDPALATALLDEAERRGASLTVLAVGSWLDVHPAMARRILGGGHELGNHTYTHPVLPRLDAAAAHAEITRCSDVLRRLTGSPGHWFRPSGTPHTTPLITTQARKAGYTTCLSYDVDPRDYSDPGPDTVTRLLLGAVQAGSIVSLHLGHPGTVTALPAILAGLQNRRLRAVTVGTLLSR